MNKKELRKQLELNLVKTIETVLNKSNAEAAKKIRKNTFEASKLIAKKFYKAQKTKAAPAKVATKTIAKAKSTAPAKRNVAAPKKKTKSKK